LRVFVLGTIVVLYSLLRADGLYDAQGPPQHDIYCRDWRICVCDSSLLGLVVVARRGRYNLRLFEESITFHGPKFTYSIPYSQIQRLFLLEKADQSSVYFAVCPVPVACGAQPCILICSSASLLHPCHVKHWGQVESQLFHAIGVAQAALSMNPCVCA
jgi:hypothetical protein